MKFLISKILHGLQMLSVSFKSTDHWKVNNSCVPRFLDKMIRLAVVHERWSFKHICPAINELTIWIITVSFSTIICNTAAKGSGLNWKFPSFLKKTRQTLLSFYLHQMKETQYALLIRNQALMVSFMSRCYCHGQHMMKLVDYEKFSKVGITASCSWKMKL